MAKPPSLRCSSARLHHASAQRHVPKMQRESHLHMGALVSAPSRRDSMCHCVLSQDHVALTVTCEAVIGTKAWRLPFGSPPSMIYNPPTFLQKIVSVCTLQTMHRMAGHRAVLEHDPHCRFFVHTCCWHCAQSALHLMRFLKVGVLLSMKSNGRGLLGAPSFAFLICGASMHAKLFGFLFFF